jgi:hypothetical protein
VFLSSLGCQVDDVQLLALLFAGKEFGFCGPLFAEIADGTVIFGPEVLLESR